MVPGRSDRYYQIPFGTHWSEVTASCFMEVGIDDAEVKRGEVEVERSCYCIHAPIHKALPQAKAVFHTHMPFASALTRLEDPRIKEIGQTEVGMAGEIAYDDEYTGPALDPAEGARLANVIGDRTILFVANTDRKNSYCPVTVKMPGKGNVQEWDCETGERLAVKAKTVKGTVSFTTGLHPSGSRMFVVGAKGKVPKRK